MKRKEGGGSISIRIGNMISFLGARALIHPLIMAQVIEKGEKSLKIGMRSQVLTALACCLGVANAFVPSLQLKQTQGRSTLMVSRFMQVVCDSFLSISSLLSTA